MSAVRTTWTVLLVAAAVAGAVVAVALGDGQPGHANRVAVLVAVLTYAVTTVVILTGRPGHPIGRLMLVGTTAWGVGEGLLAVGVQGTVTDPGSVPAAALLGVVGTAARGLGWLVLILLLALVFPDGRTAWPGRQLPWAVASGTIVLFTAASLLNPTPLESRLAGVDNPLGLPARMQTVVDGLALFALTLAGVTLVSAIAGLVRRWRRGDELLHQQLSWFIAAFACPLLVLPLTATPWAAPWMFAVVSLPVPVAVAVALLQQRLYDLMLIVSRAVTYVLLSAAVAILYAVSIGGIGTLLRERGAPWLPWVAAGVVAVSFAPLRDALQRGVNRVVHGQWSEPAVVLAAGGRRLTDAANVPGLLRSLAEDLCTTLGFTRVEIRDHAGRLLAHHDAVVRADREEPVEIPLTAYGVPVGVLRHSPRRLRPVDRELLHDVARQLGGVVHSAGLMERIRAGQERLVGARDEERRRLRRELHDGLGPTLAALTLQVDTLRNRVRALAPVAAPVGGQATVGGPDALTSGASGGGDLDGVDLDAQLLLLRSGIQATVQDVRRIVEGLRPPALDEDTVAGALRRLAASVAVAAGLVVEVDAEDTVELPAAVEAAVYRVAQEALTNVVRHARAGHVDLALVVDADAVRLRVEDDGCGLGTPRPGGIGLVTMRERAEELGGHLEVTAGQARGTRVELTIPVNRGSSLTWRGATG